MRAFEKHLEGASPQHFADIYMILIKDPFERKMATERLTVSLLKEIEKPELSLRTFDADGQSMEKIIQELDSLAFFSQKREVVIQNIDKLDKAATDQLEDYFAAPNSSVYLVLVGPAINRATNFYKKAEKAGVILDIVSEEKPWEREKSLSEWLSKETAAQGKLLNQQACQAMLKQLGTDQVLLSNELAKLICYVGERKEITIQDISEICAAVDQENIWQLGEAIFRRDTVVALRIAKAHLADGVAFFALLRQIRAQFQTEYQICTLLAHGGSAQDIAQQFPYMKGSILDRHLQLAQGYGLQNFKKGILKLDETELLAKNSGAEPELLADMLIIKLTSILQG
jgi:DNA polymerase III subunit delta